MVMGALEWIVLVFAAISLIKIVVLMVNPKSWWPVTKAFYGNRNIAGFIFVALAALVFYYLIQELTIVQIIAAGAFVALLIGIGFLQFSQDLLGSAKKILSRGFSGWTWIYVLVWIVLLGWAVYSIFQ